MDMVAGPAAPTIDADRLEASLAKALDLAAQVIRHLCPTGFHDPRSADRSFKADKPVAETAMLLHVSKGLPGRPAIDQRVRQLARGLAPFARSGPAAIELCLHPSVATKFAVPHVILSRLGLEDADFDELLSLCLQSAFRDGADRPPVADLEREWVEGLRTGRGISEASVTANILTRPLDILGGVRGDAYAFTHALMYVTDFGHRPCELPRGARATLAEAEALLARFLGGEDYDVAGEILLAWPFLGVPWSPGAALAMQLLLDADQRFGVLPGGLLDGAELAELPEGERGFHALACTYHTSYVMGFLCAATLRSGLMPAIDCDAGPPDDRLLELGCQLSADLPMFEPVLAGLPPAQTAATAPFLLDVAMARSSASHDYPQLQQLLRLADRHGLLARPMCGNAAELLMRLARCDAQLSQDRGRASPRHPSAARQ